MNYDNLSFMNIVEEDDKNWFINECSNALFQMDKNDFRLTYIDFPKFAWGSGKQYKWLVKWEEKFICISNFSDMPLYIIDGKDNHFLYFLPKQLCETECIIRQIIQNKQYVYLFINNVNISIIKFDLKTYKVAAQLSWNDEIVKKINIPFQIGNITLFNNSLWTSIINTNYIIEIDCNRFKIILHEGKKGIKHKWAFTIWNHYSYVLSDTEMDDYIIIYNLLCMKEEPKIIKLSNYINKGNFSDIRAEKNIVWFFPKDNENILKIDIFKGECIELQYPSEFFWIKDKRYLSGVRFTCIENRKEKLILYPRTGNGILCISKNKNIIEYHPLVVNMEDIREIQIKQIEKKDITLLKDDISFLIKLVSIGNLHNDKFINKKIIGLNIYNNLTK